MYQAIESFQFVKKLQILSFQRSQRRVMEFGYWPKSRTAYNVRNSPSPSRSLITSSSTIRYLLQPSALQIISLLEVLRTKS